MYLPDKVIHHVETPKTTESKSLALNFWWGGDVTYDYLFRNDGESTIDGYPLLHKCMKSSQFFINNALMLPVAMTIIIRTATNLWLDLFLWKNVFWRISFDRHAPVNLNHHYECRYRQPYQYMSEASRRKSFSDTPTSSMYVNANLEQLNMVGEWCSNVRHKCGCDSMGVITFNEIAIFILVIMTTIIAIGVARLKLKYSHRLCWLLDPEKYCLTLILILSIPTPIYMVYSVNGMYMHDPLVVWNG